jgi:hypothetical protein
MVDHPLLVPTGAGHVVLAQISQMFRNGHLRRAQNGLEMADAKRALRQQMQNAQAGFIAQTAVNFQQFHLNHELIYVIKYIYNKE